MIVDVAERLRHVEEHPRKFAEQEKAMRRASVTGLASVLLLGLGAAVFAAEWECPIEDFESAERIKLWRTGSGGGQMLAGTHRYVTSFRLAAPDVKLTPRTWTADKEKGILRLRLIGRGALRIPLAIPHSIP